jgi:hypothetical protein
MVHESRLLMKDPAVAYDDEIRDAPDIETLCQRGRLFEFNNGMLCLEAPIAKEQQAKTVKVNAA